MSEADRLSGAKPEEGGSLSKAGRAERGQARDKAASLSRAAKSGRARR
jgi:hypothetical protein